MKRTDTLVVTMVCILLAASACMPRANPAAPVAASGIPKTTPAEAEAQTLTVLAAASLTESFSELGRLFESRNPGVKVALSFAGSQQLAQQLGQGAAADVFASANLKSMDAAVTAGRVNRDEAAVFAGNRLVVVFPSDNPAGLETLEDLSKPGLKLVLADKSVPVGQYSLYFLEHAAQDPGMDAGYKEAVLQNVVSYEENVRFVLTKVLLGEADAGIVYVTDITPDAADQVGVIAIPDALNTLAAYPIAPIADSKNLDLAKEFVALVLSPEGQAILAKYGFIPVGE